MSYDEWLKTICFEQPTKEAYSLAKLAWAFVREKAAEIAWEHARDIRKNKHLGGTRFDQCAGEIREL